MPFRHVRLHPEHSRVLVGGQLPDSVDEHDVEHLRSRGRDGELRVLGEPRPGHHRFRHDLGHRLVHGRRRRRHRRVPLTRGSVANPATSYLTSSGAAPASPVGASTAPPNRRSRPA
ncbi:hypothetical protein ACFPRL_31610 [Pseudoclavibacter helvolus]